MSYNNSRGYSCLLMMQPCKQHYIHILPVIIQHIYLPYSNQLIPPNASLYYEIELLKWCASHELINKSSFEDLCEIVKFKKQRGNFLYNRKENQSAINSYTKFVFLGIVSHQLYF